MLAVYNYFIGHIFLQSIIELFLTCSLSSPQYHICFTELGLYSNVYEIVTALKTGERPVLSECASVADFSRSMSPRGGSVSASINESTRGKDMMHSVSELFEEENAIAEQKERESELEAERYERERDIIELERDEEERERGGEDMIEIPMGRVSGDSGEGKEEMKEEMKEEGEEETKEETREEGKEESKEERKEVGREREEGKDVQEETNELIIPSVSTPRSVHDTQKRRSSRSRSLIMDPNHSYLDHLSGIIAKVNLPPDLLEYLRDTYDAYDVDKDGTLDLNEFWNFIASIGIDLQTDDPAVVQVRSILLYTFILFLLLFSSLPSAFL